MTQKTESKTPTPAAKKPNRPKHYQQKECPYCHAMVGNLGNHVKMKHPTEAAQDGIKPKELTKEDLLGQKPPETPQDSKARQVLNPPVYYCTACKAKLRKGENPCWHCGEPLIWEGVE